MSTLRNMTLAVRRFAWTQFDLERKATVTALIYGASLPLLHPFEDNRIYVQLSALVAWARPLQPDWIWGLGFLGAGSAQLFGLARRRLGWRRAGALCAGLLWLVLGSSFAIVVPHNVATIPYLLIAWGNYALYQQLSRGYRA